MIVKLFTLLTAIGCLGSFSWGRRNFFVRSSEVTRHRNGLAPLGSVFGVLVVVGVALQSREDQFDVLSLFGIALFVGALLLFWSAVRAFGRQRPRIAFSSGSPDELVVQGPYRYVRHPFYSSYMLFWAGGVAAVPSVVMIIPPLVMGLLYYRAASQEELSIRQSPLGAAYAEYARSAGMFVPRLRFWRAQ